jgi:hypothetical protein
MASLLPARAAALSCSAVHTFSIVRLLGVPFLRPPVFRRLARCWPSGSPLVAGSVEHGTQLACGPQGTWGRLGFGWSAMASQARNRGLYVLDLTTPNKSPV